MLAIEGPELARGVDAEAHVTHQSLRGWMPRPGVTAPFDRVEHHVPSGPAVRVFAAPHVRRRSGLDHPRTAPVPARPAVDPNGDAVPARARRRERTLALAPLVWNAVVGRPREREQRRRLEPLASVPWQVRGRDR